MVLMTFDRHPAILRTHPERPEPLHDRTAHRD